MPPEVILSIIRTDSVPCRNISHSTRPLHLLYSVKFLCHSINLMANQFEDGLNPRPRRYTNAELADIMLSDVFCDWFDFHYNGPSNNPCVAYDAQELMEQVVSLPENV